MIQTPRKPTHRPLPIRDGRTYCAYEGSDWPCTAEQWRREWLASSEAEAALAVARARFVAEKWRDAIMASEELRRTGMSHPVVMVLAALDGETDPVHVGLNAEHHAAYRQLAEQPQ
jgi:hypothetical protein